MPTKPPSRLVGIDVGGTKVALAVGDASGALHAKQRRPTAPSGDAVADLKRLAGEVRALLGEADAKPEQVACIGVSVPGPFDPERGVLLTPPNLPGWNDAPVRAVLQDELGTPVSLENDANAAALAEWRFGGGRGAQHVVYLTLSTGIGGGLVLGGRLHRGLRAAAGEVGHIAIVPDGETCACGMRGCLEAYAGGAAWIARLARVTPAESRVAELASGAANARPEHVVEAAREGDAFALAEMDRYNGFVARGIAGLVFALAPEVVVLGTIPTAAGEALSLAPIRKRVGELVWPLLARDLRIVPAELGEDLGYLAGLCVAIEAIEGDAA